MTRIRGGGWGCRPARMLLHQATFAVLRRLCYYLEIQNPGGLLPGLTLEQVLAGGESRRCNPVIAEVLRQMGR